MKKQVSQNRKLIRKSDPQVHFAVIGDSHVGFDNSGKFFKAVLQQAVKSGNKKFVIFGGEITSTEAANQEKFIWLDNANGKFSKESLDLLKQLDPNHF